MYDLVIDDEVFSVDFISLVRTQTFEDKYLQQTEDGTIQRELIGVRSRYDMRIGFERDYNQYERLYKALSSPKSYKTITVPKHGSGTYTFEAYQESVNDETDALLLGINDLNYYKSLTTTFIARKPTVE